MKKIIKKFIKKILRIKEPNVAWFKNFGFKTIIDVGASKGNFSFKFHTLFSEAYIYAFEPLAGCSEIIRKKLAGVANFTLFDIALSDFKGYSKIFRSSYSGASSLLKMASLQKKLFPVTAGESIEYISVDTLDNVFSKIDLKEPILIKLDVQGTEDKVIKGGTSIFAKTKAVITETSFVRLYEGQPLFNDICRLLEDLGFKYAGIWGGGDFKSPVDGQPLQQDSIFLRE